MATASDAELILKLYEMRREETLRRSRRFMVFDFQPKTLEELRAVSRDVGSQHNAAWRQVLGYWEMAASLVLRGALDPDLFLDSNGEGILIYAKFHHFHAETEKQSGHPVYAAYSSPHRTISGGRQAARRISAIARAYEGIDRRYTAFSFLHHFCYNYSVVVFGVWCTVPPG